MHYYKDVHAFFISTFLNGLYFNLSPDQGFDIAKLLIAAAMSLFVQVLVKIFEKKFSKSDKTKKNVSKKNNRSSSSHSSGSDDL